MALTHLQIVSVPVSDPERSRAFYQDILGFDLLADMSMGPDQRWLQLGPRGAQTSITLVTWFPTMAPGSLKGLVLATDALDAEVARLTSHGLALAPIKSAPWGRYSTFDDPDGNGWVLQASPS